MDSKYSRPTNNPIKYPNDPTDPTKPGKPTETLPYVPGYTPKDGNGQPLKPVDPKDPSKDISYQIFQQIQVKTLKSTT